MNIQCYLLNGEFIDQQLDDFEQIVQNLDEDILYEMPVDLIVKLLARFGKELTRTLIHEEGVYYLATWLRPSNLSEYLSINLGDKQYLDTFVKGKNHLSLRAQPRGIVCHWIAGNVPTLAIFSLVQSILCKNVNIIRVPEANLPGVLRMLKLFNEITVEHEGEPFSGSDILKTVSVVYFPSSEVELNKKFSLCADCKVIWGGKEAVQAILALPQREHCESIVFGPKYSFAVIDEDSITPELCKKLVMDIITFEQDACSSPHVVFCESKRKGDSSVAKVLANELAEAFKQISKKYPKPPGNYTDILNARGMYWLDPSKDVVCSEALDWTILINNEVQLEEPIASRTVFVKAVDSVFDIIPLITHKVQTLGVALADARKRSDFCEKATYKGVSRCVNVGSMNDYDTPWDGILFINRLVRWTSMRIREHREGDDAER